MTTIPTTSAEVRTRLVDILRRDLVGPSPHDIDISHERLRDTPSRWYLTGFIAPGVDALCHISQIANVRLTKPNDVLSEGMEVDARVLEVSNEARRVSISIKEVEPINPPGYEEHHEE